MDGAIVGVRGDTGVGMGVLVGGVTRATCDWKGDGKSDGMDTHKIANKTIPIITKAKVRFMAIFLSGRENDCHSADSQPGVGFLIADLAAWRSSRSNRAVKSGSGSVLSASLSSSPARPEGKPGSPGAGLSPRSLADR